jgi:GNAT superfamily N-acetyltransferase
MTDNTIKIARTDAEIARCFPVIQQLRPHLIESEFVSRIRRMESEKYQLVFLADENASVRSVAGFRLMEMLYAGRMLYVDDLITDSASRSAGFGEKLFAWLTAHARELGCDELALDSGTQRVEAHRFYLRQRMKINCFHFSLPLKG